MTDNTENQQKISNLIRLMDDADAFVRAKVREQLLNIGEDALPFLEIAANDENPGIRVLARKLIADIFPIKLGKKFTELSQAAGSGDLDLEKGMQLIMEFGYPGADPNEVKTALDRLAHELSSRLSNKDTPEQLVQKVTGFLFAEKGFAGNQTHFLDPDNTYFNKVLENKTGIPITLSALCILIAQRLGLPLVGVGLPGHYIAKYNAPKDPVFFDPFHAGRILSREDCIQRVENFGHKFEEHHLSQATHRETLVRMMNNLIIIYNQNKELEKSRQLTQFINILLKSPQSFSSQST